MASNLSRRDFIKSALAGTATVAAAGLLGTPVLADEKGTYIPGTYTATANGIGVVKVTMTFDAESITDVVLDVSGETASIGQVAADELKAAILDAQDSEIEAVSGATITSTAVMQAAAKCIAQAKGETVVEVKKLDEGSEEDWLGTEPDIDDDAIAETWETDILIVGAGNGGMCAAAYAAQNDLDFRIIEQNPNVQDTRHWYGAIDSSESKKAGVTVNRKKLLGEISRYASGKCNQRVVKTWIEESAAMHDFVSGILESDPYNYKCIFTAGEEARWPESEDSTDFMFPEQEHTYRGAEKPRNIVFQEYIEGKGYSIDFNTSLVKLEKDEDGRVTGAIAQKVEDGSFIRINAANGVLLACGGYPGNPYMMEALDPLGTSVTTACSFSPSDKGMGIRAAIWAGGKK